MGVVRATSLYDASIDTTLTAFSRRDGGSFETIAEVFDYAPSHSMVLIQLLPGQTYDLDALITLHAGRWCFGLL